MTENLSGDPSNRRSSSNRIWLIVAVIGFIAVIQWPTLKDLYFQTAGSPESKIPWLHQSEAAFAEAAKSERPILAVFGASWCSPCQTMKREVWADGKVADAVEARFIPLYIDVDDETEDGFVTRYQISGIPAVLVLNAKGEIQEQRQWMSRSEALDFLSH